jgi:hypothetical protein
METLVPTGSGSRNLLQSDTTHCIISPYRYFGVKTQQTLSLMEDALIWGKHSDLSAHDRLCLSPLMLSVQISIRAKCTTLCDKVFWPYPKCRLFLVGISVVCLMVFNATFNNISITSISWLSVLLMEETGEPGENHWQTCLHGRYISWNIHWRIEWNLLQWWEQC